ncbi:hypothetical protein TSUD_07030 [Trifolium subterraneum]|uniref:Uncharacterized protein n=1 Tax=Trifolium subterraneum TaxID=3900 RepID=A0A2Z6LNL4_TRISU|nr:hypothetical protein TSUD_07030 [Trifolium subterraneum]
MASASVSMSLPLTQATHKNFKNPSSNTPFLKPLPFPQAKKTLINNSSSKSNLAGIQASLKDKTVKGLTAFALTASMVLPEAAHAAGNDFSPSLKNFLLSIAAGGVVLTAILGAVIGVSNFDPVKRT